MALQIAKLASPQFIPTTASAIYTNPTGIKTRIKEFKLHNAGTATATVKIHLVYNDAGALSSAQTVNRTDRVILNPDESVHIPYSSPIPLDDPNDAVFAESTVANSVTILLLGGKDDGI